MRLPRSKIESPYIAKAVKRYRPGGFMPTQFDGCILWLRADLGITIDVGVSEWKNQAADNLHPVQANTDYQPTVHNNAINGHAAIQFDGTDDYLQCTDTLAQPYIYYIVLNHITYEFSDYIYAGAGLSNAGNIITWTNYYLHSGSSVDTGINASSKSGVWVILSVLYNGANSKFRLNNGEWVTSLDPGTDAGGGVTLGGYPPASNWANVEYAEAITYLEDKTILGEDSIILNYLNSRYAIY